MSLRRAINPLRRPRAFAHGVPRVDPEPFESPFDRLTVLSKVEGLTAPREIEGRSLSAVEGSEIEQAPMMIDFIGGLG